MRSRSIRLGRVLGLDIRADLSWFPVFGTLAWLLATRLFWPFITWHTLQRYAAGGLAALLFFLSVLLHELGHALVSAHFGLSTHHITLLPYGGVAELDSRPPEAHIQLWIALAGPMVNLALWGLFAVVEAREGSPEALVIARFVANANMMLAALNLIPAQASDGGQVVEAALWRLQGDAAGASGLVALIGRLVGFAAIGLGAWQAFAGNLVVGMSIAASGLFLGMARAEPPLTFQSAGPLADR